MLINCTSIEDPNDVFVINPPTVLPKGTKMSYHDRYYIIDDILYDDESGIIDYIVSKDRNRRQGFNKDMDAQVLEFCRNKMKLQAVKYVKECIGVGLKEAKDYVDALCDKYGL